MFGLTFEKQTPGYLNLCITLGNQLISSGHVSTPKGKLGKGLSDQERAPSRARMRDKGAELRMDSLLYLLLRATCDQSAGMCQLGP